MNEMAIFYIPIIFNEAPLRARLCVVSVVYTVSILWNLYRSDAEEKM